VFVVFFCCVFFFFFFFVFGLSFWGGWFGVDFELVCRWCVDGGVVGFFLFFFFFFGFRFVLVFFFVKVGLVWWFLWASALPPFFRTPPFPRL